MEVRWDCIICENADRIMTKTIFITIFEGVESKNIVRTDW